MFPAHVTLARQTEKAQAGSDKNRRLSDAQFSSLVNCTLLRRLEYSEAEGAHSIAGFCDRFLV
jgi:2'-5' RNA ligase